MKVLILTYYWPPAGGSGVQRWLKFVKYLRHFDIEPVVYTVDKANYPISDVSLQKDIPEGIEVLKTKIFDPNDLLRFLGGSSKDSSAGFLNKNPNTIARLLQYIRANFFIPDARQWWIKPSVRYLTKYLKANKIDAIISSGPPHSLHLMAMSLKTTFNLKWIADFRDPWTSIDYFDQLPLTKKSIAKHHYLEQQVLTQSNAVIVVSNEMKKEYEKYNREVRVITNGFDREDAILNVDLDQQFTLTHIGMMNADRNPEVLWEVISELCLENKSFKDHFKIQLIGKIAPEIWGSINKYGLNDFVKHIAYVPHNDIAKYQYKSQALLLVVNNVPSKKGIVTGKVFEYLQANRPILAIGPEDGDLAQIIQQTQSGKIFDYTNKVKLKEQLLFWFEQYKNSKLMVSTKCTAQYERKNLTSQLAQLIKSI